MRVCSILRVGSNIVILATMATLLHVPVVPDEPKAAMLGALQDFGRRLKQRVPEANREGSDHRKGEPAADAGGLVR